MNRIIGEIQGTTPGPLLIFIGGLHGNEKQGVVALENVFNKFNTDPNLIRGRAIAVKGNLEAMTAGKRYISKDLNRIWGVAEALDENEIHEVKEYRILRDLINAETEKNSYTNTYLIDLHTTSAPTIPFAVTRDTDTNRRFIEQLDIPFITGLEGHMEGTLLEWMSDKGYCSLAFEAGQHHSHQSAVKHEAFVRLAMYYSGFITAMSNEELRLLRNFLEAELKTKHNHFVLTERYKIAEGERFEMEPGFSNFERIHKGEILAKNQNGDILAKSDANIFMPLYQKQGDDGFFIIKPSKVLDGSY